MNLISKVYAQANLTPPDNPLPRFTSLATVLGFVMNVVFYVGISLTLIFLIIGGIRYIVSGGDKAGTEAARGMITNAVIGFVVVIGAFAVKVVLEKVIGTEGGPLPVVPRTF